MDVTSEENHHNGTSENVPTLTTSDEMIVSPHLSNTLSRTNSTSTLKCDNVMKYPNRNQIEEKLNKIREYIEVTTLLMSGMKNIENEDMRIGNIPDRDLAKKKGNESTILNHRHEKLIKLKERAENKLKELQQLQISGHCDSGLEGTYNKEINISLPEIDKAIAELEERAKKVDYQNQYSHQDKILGEIDILHNQIVNMHNATNEREQFIEILDNRGIELKSQQLELQTKLDDLQKRKIQVDNLAIQLAHPEAIDQGTKRKKDLLKDLKDMYEGIKTAENMPCTISTTDYEDGACGISTNEHFLQNELHVNSNDGLRRKQINNVSKDSLKKQKSRTSSFNEKFVLQTELDSKKKELEELMGKHKAGTSNLNHDVGIDNKSEFSCSTNVINSRMWISQNEDNNSEKLSCDEFDERFLASRNFQPTPVGHQTISKSAKEQKEQVIDGMYGGRFQNLPGSEQDITIACSNAEAGKLRKQLQAIKNMCDSMIEQQHACTHQSNVQNSRNNTPSAIYSEPQYQSTNGSHTQNMEGVLFCNANQSNMLHEFSYQSWMSSNAIQTQSFMLNTLNQCYQMLWLQQKELQSLKNAISLIQERLDSCDCRQQNRLNIQNSCYQSIPKTNQVSATCSMPNLNHYNVIPTNLDICSNTHGLSPNNANDNTNGNVIPSHICNGQALNNQIPPGNRTNNCWGNYRR